MLSKRIKAACTNPLSEDRNKNGKVQFLLAQNRRLSTGNFLESKMLEMQASMVTRITQIAGLRNRVLQVK